MKHKKEQKLKSWLQQQLQPSKERTTAHNSQELKNAFSKKLSREKKSGMVIIVSVNLRNKNLLRKKILGNSW
jgi:hypothetical protein